MPEPTSPPRDMIISETFIQKYATVLTTAIFCVVGVTGLLLFFHIGPGAVKGVHEWLGIAFVAATAIHLVRNWNGFVKLLKRKRTQAVCAIAAIAAVAFIAFAPDDGGNPLMRLVGVIETAPIEALAPVLGTSTQGLVARLEAQGITVSSPDQSLAQLAKAQGADARHLIRALLEGGARER